MREEIVQRQAAAMSEQGLDALPCCSPENLAYTAGFVVPSQPLIRHRRAMCIVDASGGSAVFAVDMEATTIAARLPDTRSRIWSEFTEIAMAVLADYLTELGLASARIGVETDYLPAGDMARLRTALPTARLEPGEGLLAQLRQTKTQSEIALLRRLSRIADRAITDSLSAVSAGDSEMELDGELTRRIYELGAEHFKLLIVATGERSDTDDMLVIQ